MGVGVVVGVKTIELGLPPEDPVLEEAGSVPGSVFEGCGLEVVVLEVVVLEVVVEVVVLEVVAEVVVLELVVVEVVVLVLVLVVLVEVFEEPEHGIIVPLAQGIG